MALFRVINGVSLFLALVSTVFFIFGCMSYSFNSKSMQDTAWFQSTKDTTNGYFTLRGIYFTVDGSRATFLVKYNNMQVCLTDACVTCSRDGETCFSVLVAAVCVAFAVAVFSALCIPIFNKGLQLINIFLAFASAALSLISVGFFMAICYPEMRDQTVLNQVGWGPGAIVVVTGMLVMWAVMFLQVAAVAAGSGEHESTSTMYTGSYDSHSFYGSPSAAGMVNPHAARSLVDPNSAPRRTDFYAYPPELDPNSAPRQTDFHGSREY
jgi:hypothetical protein